MKKIVKTKLHIFSINLIESKTTCDFEIIAKCIADKTKSSITNLNFIISELLEPTIKIDDYETTITVNKKIGKEIYNESIVLFNDIEWLNLLEIALEDDKDAGEWG